MKTIAEYVKRRNLHAVPIAYHFNGIYSRRKGYDIADAAGNVILSLEPVSYRHSPLKWIIRSRSTGVIYVKRITPKALSFYDGETKYIHRLSPSAWIREVTT